MDVKTAILNRRSIRKFEQTPIEGQKLVQLVDLARFHATGGNTQPLSYAIVTKNPLKQKVFDLLAWAAYLPDYTCTEEYQPAAYIILLRDETKTRACMYDLGAASTTIMLATTGIFGGLLHIVSWFALAWSRERKVWVNLALALILFMSFNTQNLTWDIFLWLLPVMALLEKGIPFVQSFSKANKE